MKRNVIGKVLVVLSLMLMAQMVSAQSFPMTVSVKEMKCSFMENIKGVHANVTNQGDLLIGLESEIRANEPFALRDTSLIQIYGYPEMLLLQHEVNKSISHSNIKGSFDFSFLLYTQNDGKLCLEPLQLTTFSKEEEGLHR
jgi:hypothetical protein